MKMKIGPEVERQIILKYRQKLKALLAEHEVRTDNSTHMILLGDLIRIVENDLNHTEGTTYEPTK